MVGIDIVWTGGLGERVGGSGEMVSSQNRFSTSRLVSAKSSSLCSEGLLCLLGLDTLEILSYLSPLGSICVWGVNVVVLKSG